MKDNSMQVHQRNAEPWQVTLVDTGEDTQTGGRLKRVSDYVKNEDAFCFTYGDGVSDVDVTALIYFHQNHGKLATVTAVAPPGRFGALERNGLTVSGFIEKPAGDGGLINGGYFVLSPKCLDLIVGDSMPWESYPMKQLASDSQLMAFEHRGFWQPMDTLRDKHLLQSLWESGKAPWKVWN
jgi:glucose-1-phosphate cytidylyltransferase